MLSRPRGSTKRPVASVRAVLSVAAALVLLAGALVAGALGRGGSASHRAWIAGPLSRGGSGVVVPPAERHTARSPFGGEYELPARLNTIAQVYSLGNGEVRCPTAGEWDELLWSWAAWGMTNTEEDTTTLAPFVCAGALAVGDADTDVPLWQRGVGVWVLVHESYHLRHWRYRRDEGKVSCQTIVHFTEAAQRLGATPAEADELFPYAFALYDRESRLFSWYGDDDCVLPYWFPPPIP